MIVDLNKKDLWNLLTGTDPGYRWYNFLEDMKLGSYTEYGGWKWTFYPPEHFNMDEDKIWNLYKQIIGKE